MTVTPRTTGLLAVAFCTVLVPSVQAQQARPVQPSAPINRPQLMPLPNTAGMPAPTAPNMAYLGSGSMPIAPYVGYNPYTPITPVAPALVGGGVPASPYSLSTVGGYNPYFGSRASMDSSPYSLSTAPVGGGVPFMGGGFFPGIGYTPNSMGYGFGLMGIADYTRASGQYWRDIQAARMTREMVRQEELETAKRRVQYEMWYETMRPTAGKMRDAEMIADLDRARKDPPDTEIQSGRALNILLQSVQRLGKLNRVSSADLNEETLKHLNLTGGTSSGNLGMLKDVSRIEWPDALQEAKFEETRKRLAGNLKKAVDSLKDRERPDAALRKDIDADFKSLNDMLNASADELPVSQYIDARRFMNQLSSGIRALRDPNAENIFKGSWAARGRNIAELVENMTKDGLTFAPSAPGDEPYYRAVYLALRNFEINLQNESR